jgi:hypothetical protein
MNQEPVSCFCGPDLARPAVPFFRCSGHIFDGDDIVDGQNGDDTLSDVDGDDTLKGSNGNATSPYRRYGGDIADRDSGTHTCTIDSADTRISC